MQIYNKGMRNFTTSFGTIVPGKPHPVPAGHEAEAEKLLKHYPGELVDGGAAQADVNVLRSALAKKDAEIATLKAQNEKLRKLLEATPGTADLGKPEEPPATTVAEEPAPEPAAPPAAVTTKTAAPRKR